MPSRSRAEKSAEVRLLVVDRDSATAAALDAALAARCIDAARIEVAPNGRVAADMLRRSTYHVVLLDVLSIADAAPSMEEAVARLVKLAEGALTVAISGESSVSAAVAAMRAGAHDFVSRPLDGAALVSRIGELAHRHGKLRTLTIAGRKVPYREGFAGLLGTSSQMQFVYEQIERIAPSSDPVFITGESGTGKGLCAEALHEQSPRRGKRFVSLDCAEMPRERLEAELFGIASGAVSGADRDRAGAIELADGGTLFLGEIGVMDLSLQARLLRFLETGSFSRLGETGMRSADVRVVCATGRNPMQLIADKAFREDLFYRLHVLPIHLPPLRQRPADILVLACHFLGCFGREVGKRFEGFSPAAADMLAAHDWPGNVSELKQAMRRVVAVSGGRVVELPAIEQAGIGGVHEPLDGAERRPAILPMWRQEQRIIEDAIAHCGGNVALAAAALELSPSTIYRKRQAWAEMEGRRGAA